MGATTGLAGRSGERTHPLRDASDLDPLLERVGDARCVLLGEASHGPAEYYSWRACISERLVREKAFSFIAIEGDWPDCSQPSVLFFMVSPLEARCGALEVSVARLR